jgi:hypothetical protein
MDLVEQGLEAFVFVQPCANLGKQFLGDVNGAGLAVLFEGEVLSTMERSAVVTAAGGSSTAVGVLAEGGSQDGRGGGQFFETPLKHAEQVAGMSGKEVVHGISRRQGDRQA